MDTKYRMTVLLVSAFLGACVSSAYYEPQAGSMLFPGVPNPVNPDRYRIEDPPYCLYFADAFVPPSPRWGSSEAAGEMAPVVPSDRWCVTHRIADYDIVQSDSYNERLCNQRSTYRCSHKIDYALWVSQSKQIAGWVNLPSSSLLLSERTRNLESPVLGDQWPDATEIRPPSSARRVRR